MTEEHGENGPYPDGHYDTWPVVIAADTCSEGCALASDQIKQIEADAIEAMQNYEPIID